MTILKATVNILDAKLKVSKIKRTAVLKATPGIPVIIKAQKIKIL